MTPSEDTHRDPDRLQIERTVIVHGFGAGIDDHWFPWLADRLDRVDRVELPASSRPDAATWIPLVARAIGDLDERTAVVAHSLGCVTAAQAILRLARSVPAARLGVFVAVAPFADPLAESGLPDLDAFTADGLDAFLTDVDLRTVAAATVHTHVMRSDDDPIVSTAQSEEFAEALGAPVCVVPGAGHFLGSNGVTRLQPVLDILCGAA
ncbi:RBBP9/YdeN family alpha/beta hydrolase [Gordonia soli]|nr:alpha/beta hydrolase [Gordonia soli]